jgi:uncharacterized membrane protein
MKELHRQSAEALKAPSEYGGTVLKTSLSEDAERELQEALHGCRWPPDAADVQPRARA